MRIRNQVLLLLSLGCFVFSLTGTPPAYSNADKWRKRLTRSDVDEVYKSIQLAARNKDADAALPLVERAIDAELPHIAVACGDALHEIGPKPFKDGKIKKLLKKQQKAKDARVQKNVARLLAAWNHPVVAKELAYYMSGRRDPDVQAEALFMAGGTGPRGEDPDPKATAKAWKSVRDAVLKAVEKGRTEEVRCGACSAAGRLKITEAAEPLVTIAKRSREDYEGLYAIWALKKMGHTGSLASFIHVLSSGPRRQTRQACLKGVTELSDLGDVPELLAFSRHNKKDYRDAAVLALARLPWRAQRGRLPGVAKKPEKVVTGEGEDDLLAGKKLKDPPLEVPDEVIDRCIEIVEDDSDWEVRDAARQALIRFGEKARAKVQASMPALITFSDYDASLTGIELCGLFGASRALKELIKVALYDKDPVRRIFAARALEGIEPKTAVAELNTHIKPAKRARQTQLNAVFALGYIRHKAAFDAIVAMFEVGEGDGGFSEEMMRDAEYAIERLTGHRFGRKPDIWRKWYPTEDLPFYPGVQKFNRVENRREAVSKNLYGLTRTTERAVENGLRWLERQQHTIGLWDGAEKGFGGVTGCEPAYTGLALLSLLGAGYNGADGRYRETIRRSTEFLTATQFYDGGYPVTGGGDQSWVYAYQIAMGIWGICESYALSGDEDISEPSQWGIDYLVRVQTPGAGWRYGPRYKQSDTSCTSWVMMTMKTADLAGLEVAQRSMDGIDWWLQRCSQDITGEVEILADLASDYDYEVGARRYFKAFAGYFELSGAEASSLQQVSMTAVTMVCRFFQGWKRSHPFMIGASNYLSDGYLPQWMKGLEKGMAIAWYHYYWYYGTLAFHQMGGRYWRKWNEKIKRMYPEKQRKSPPELAGSWDPDTAVLNGGRIFSTAMSILSLQSYYRFSPLMDREVDQDEEKKGDDKKDGEKKGD
ncbi:MAG: hypothetical protein QNJ98_01515 [Planctomycetota bacterium]|nr:hypothetical protein [Planctomycetota bacterium]